MKLFELFTEAVERKASDIHLGSGEIPAFRVSGDLVRVREEPFTHTELLEALEPFFKPRDLARVDEGLPVEHILEHADMTFVGIAFRYAEDRLSVTFRLLSGGVPSLDQIGGDAKEILVNAVDAPRGLILVTGPTASGKWTTGCSLVEHINLSKALRVFVAESHPNFRFKSQKSMVTPIHVGQDCDSYETAISNALQSDLDVFALDDIPNLSVLREVLILAGTGHLVLANLHADSAADALRRLCSAAGSEGAEIRRILCENLVLVTGQRLFRKIERGRAAAYEWLSPTQNVKEALMSGDFDRLEKLAFTEPGCRSLASAIEALVEGGVISEESAASYR